MQARLMGKAWEVEFVPRYQLGDDDGSCDPPDSTGKRIRIADDLNGEALLDTLIHEMLHACVDALDESYVERTASGIARALYRLGYRREASRGEQAGRSGGDGRTGSDGRSGGDQLGERGADHP